MQIQCDCSKFKATIYGFPQTSAGRHVCYCDDCQTYMHYLKRQELLDPNGGTEVIPVYPKDFKIDSGIENLKCIRLSPNGLYRWVAGCCNTPIGNTNPSIPWIGLINRVFFNVDRDQPERSLGAVKSRVMGKFAKGTPPKGTHDKMGFKAFTAVAPYLLKGVILGKTKGSALFSDNKETIVAPKVLTKEERNQIRSTL